jgi:alpha-L-rhamnosidase
LKHLDLTTPSVKGLITLHYRHEPTYQTLDVTVPMNTTAKVELPDDAQVIVVHDQYGKDWTASIEHDHDTLTIPMGRYQIQYQA